MNIIVAYDKQRGIGINNTLPWPKLKEDMKWFQENTKNSIILMGRKTFESLPELLKNREHWILTRNYSYQPDGVKVFHSLKEIKEAIQHTDKTVWCIGGSELFNLVINSDIDIQSYYVTEIDRIYVTDTHFPNIDSLNYSRHFIKHVIDRNTNIGLYFYIYSKKEASK